MGREKIIAGLIGGCLIAAVGTGPTGCSNDRPIVVGSKNFTEQVILGEIVAQHLEHRLGQKVDRRLNLGGTLLAHQALVKGDLNLYPEYTGTALTSILKLPLSAIAVGGGPAKGAPPTPTPAEVLAKVRAEYLSRFRIQWLDPLGFNSTFAMVIRGEDARRNRIETLSDAGRHARGWTLGVGYEFQQRPDGLAGLMKTYKLPIKGSPKTMDLGLLYKALEQKQVDMVAANATDGLLSVLDVRVLRDDKGYFPPYQPALVVRAETLKANPLLWQALNELAGKFSDQLMRKLNHQVDGEHRPVREVAQAFLRENGLLP